MKELIDGRRRFRGRLDGFEGGEVRIEIELGGAAELDRAEGAEADSPQDDKAPDSKAALGKPAHSKAVSKAGSGKKTRASKTQVIGLPVGLIEQAKLMLTDDLVRAALQRQSPQEAAIVAAAEKGHGLGSEMDSTEFDDEPANGPDGDSETAKSLAKPKKGPRVAKKASASSRIE